MSFDARLDLVPERPGVYLMKSDTDEVIYVGKAINLRRRLASYFAKHPKGNEKVLAMIRRIADFSYLICESELEALILESNLIKKYQPFYNILLKDDHDYPYLKISFQEDWPRLTKAYRIGSDALEGAKYYGPFLNAELKKALETLHKLFPLKRCKRVFPRDIGKERPCLNYHIGRCIGPCTGNVSQASYRALMNQVASFLEGDYTSVLNTLESEMNNASALWDFEKAAHYRDRIQAMKHLLEKQYVSTNLNIDADILSIASEGEEACVQKLELRQGRITGTSTFFFEENDLSESALMKAFITQFYLQAAIPYRIFASPLPDDVRLLSDFLTYLKHKGAMDGFSFESFDSKKLSSDFLKSFKDKFPQRGNSLRKCRITEPKRFEKGAVLALAKKNAFELLRRRRILSGKKKKDITLALSALKSLFNLHENFRRIEAYDVANLGDDAIVCSMVVFVDGFVQRADQRHFKMRLVQSQDDYEAMREAISRRLDRLDDIKFGEKPDLILLDGGLGHLRSIQTLFEDRGIHNIVLGAMVKDKKHKTRGLVLQDGHFAELASDLALTEIDNSVHKLSSNELLIRMGLSLEDTEIKKTHVKRELLHFLTKIQDEAHRVAGDYHRKLRKKTALKFKLEEIKGIGPVKRKQLMKTFGSIKAVSKASKEDLRQANIVLSERDIDAIISFFSDDTEDNQEF